MMDELPVKPHRPLEGITVLDFTHAAAGPLCTMLLADFGATVIKVEKPGRGDGSRHMRMSGKFANPLIGSDYYLGLNRNKFSVGIDLGSDRGIAVARALAAKADVIVQNFRPGVLEKLGLGQEELSKGNERLIYCDIAAFPPNGPLADAPGMDIVIQARAGTIAATGHPGGEPVKPAPSLADLSGGLQATIGILLALTERAKSGKGQKVSVSLYHATLLMLANYAAAVLNTDEEIEPMGSGHPQLAPYQAFPTSDDWIFIAVGTNALWRRLCGVLGLADLADDARFTSNWARVQNKKDLIGILNSAFRTRSAKELLALLAKAGVPASPIVSVREAHHRELKEGSSAVSTIDHPDYGAIHLPGLPIELSATPASVYRYPPRLGEDTQDILRRVLKMEEAHIEELIASGAVSQYPK